MVAPFTAPFSTCDLAMLLSHHTASAAVATPHTLRPVAVDELLPDASPGPLLDEEKIDHAFVDAVIVLPDWSSTAPAPTVAPAAPRLARPAPIALRL